MQNKVFNIVKTFCNDLVSFTSLDVSNTVKQEGFSDARHRDIAPIVRQMFADSVLDDFGYMRTLIDVELLSELKTKTNLYHHVSVSPDSYFNRKQIAIPPKKSDGVPAPTTCHPILPPPPIVPIQTPIFTFNDSQHVLNTIADNSDMGFDKNELECYCKSDGRLEIPIGWVRDFDFRPGDVVGMALKNNKICLSLDTDDEDWSVAIGSTTVTPDNRLRVTKTAFMKAGFDYSPNSKHLVRKVEDSEEFEIEDTGV
ncbi:MAG: hypothetical protein WC516_04815 [Patescibacteria group bacterium]